jgi:hypothetical protein
MFNSNTGDQQLLNDKQVSELTSFSIGWIRKQRYDRNSGSPHKFDVDPIYVGSAPRYKKDDVTRWIANLNGGRNE